MSRVYQKPAAPTARRAPAARSPQRPTPTASTTDRAVTRGGRVPVRGRTTHIQPPRQERNDSLLNNESTRVTPPQEERTVHVGSGYQMFTPSTTKREQMRRQAENEQRQYEAHIERTRLHDIHEVNRLGGGGLSEEEVRRRQAEKYRRDKFARLEKTHQDQSRIKEEEERELDAKKQSARQQSMLNEKRATGDRHDQGASGWTDRTHEEDRRETMDRFFNRFTQQVDQMNISSNDDTKPNQNDEKLSILRDMLPHVDDQTLKYNLDVYNGDVEAIVHELLN